MNKWKELKYNKSRLGMLKIGEEFIIFVIIFFLVFRFVVGFSLISGNSMQTTLKNGQPVFYFRLDRGCERGDVVSIRMPTGEYLVKRIVAVEGDTVDIQNGKVYLNGEVLEEAYANGETEPSVEVSYPLTVEAGHVYVLGDNRSVSVDSRVYGTLASSQVRGTLIGVH